MIPLESENPLVRQIEALRARLDEIMARNPRADRENVWHTLLLLQEEPIERLRRSLMRGRALHPQR